MRIFKNKRGGMTGGQRVMIGFAYMIVVFIYFAYLPDGTYTMSGGGLDEVSYDSMNATAAHTDEQNVDVFDVFKGLFSFGITGADLPWFYSILAVYLPILWIALGVYELIRGGT